MLCMHIQYEAAMQVDWLGQKHQIDAALKAGIEKVVVISSMGGTDPENVLNKVSSTIE